ncbi:unnamed protein product, partial [Prunus brigantina]
INTTTASGKSREYHIKGFGFALQLHCISLCIKTMPTSPYISLEKQYVGAFSPASESSIRKF